MKKNLRTFARVRNVMFAFATVFALTQCADEEIINEVEATQEITESDATSDLNIGSITISGENTFVAEADLDCTTCTYVVSKNATLINGSELGLKPGSIICLDKALTYGNLEFENLIGTSESPVVIGRTSFPKSN